MSATSTQPGDFYERDEDGYLRFHQAVSSVDTAAPLFRTMAGEGLFDIYLNNLPASNRQHYDCSACRKFINDFGGLVRIDEKGNAFPLFWFPSLAGPFFHDASQALYKAVSKAKVNGVFLSTAKVLGTPETGPWRHLHAPNAQPFRATALRTAWQAMAEKDQDYEVLSRSLAEFSPDVVRNAEALLKSEALYRAEKVLGVATWFRELQDAIGATKKNRANLVWRAVATAPPGWCHVRSSMIGTLLEDLASGMDTRVVARRFKDKMDPLGYQRPQAAPSAGNIARAEKVVAELSAAGSLERRYARLSDIQALWMPAPTKAPASSGGVFGHLKTPPAGRPLEIPSVTMTWEKFARTLLPTASRIELLVPQGLSGFAALVTAVNPDAPPILQWDREDARNPVSWYFYAQGSLAHQWNLMAGTWVPVTAICSKPSQWGDRPLAQHGEGAFLLLQGAKDVKRDRGVGLALFPEILRSEFRKIRGTIEAFSASGTLAGLEESDACGFGLTKGGTARWGVHLRVYGLDGVISSVMLDRWD